MSDLADFHYGRIKSSAKILISDDTLTFSVAFSDKRKRNVFAVIKYFFHILPVILNASSN